ncbi:MULTISPECIES: ABC transporter ATP-binding protein [Desulfococcus]|jgi:multiple sugar transport system ATP-binding protein|uniref:ABC transporter related protein n=1 Tax=Desulfococcus multivorans DSM 2059 TaxID=1121405 RepID=S7TZG5_DESML|nr:sn-glycerol-3-phosphate ABC transporter ATP-binding protein UgpC [Desulfococcus multivorans]AOY58349.1 putative ABC transporter, ATP-binding protein [Desulfococcus multivorans]AQV00681.1 ABC transporter ATP-binding protein [Desulfococcus multivorans]EPR42576.1 ABC transporter related protein [Desulfococcus multivorans DSM 2059]MDX9818152.1 sn-glycerol-3-phosphate ABC transporter ATP-binding protein UgpC [Desulfococcus multivorans]SKA18375.1 carbohydrate ABC transporter ATP-binding protein, 
MASIVFDQVKKYYDGETPVVDHLDLEVRDGEFLVLVGPSGCGKSTVLRMAAGLEMVSDGEIRIGGRVVNDLPPQQRNVAMVFQNYALYPHMTVRRNLEFPLRMQKLPRREIARRVSKTAEMLGLSPVLDRRPKTLSGGQRQRVAMGRAIVRDADVFLMDEPLSNLDARLRIQIRTDIAALQARLRVTTLYVTHDQVEAMTMGQRVAVMRSGKLEQTAPPQALYERPASVFVAGFIGSPGMNILRAELASDDNGLAARINRFRLALPDDIFSRCPTLEAWIGRELLVGIRPEGISLADEHDDAGIPAAVRATESLGHETILHAAAEVTTVAFDAQTPFTAVTETPILSAVLRGHRPLRHGEPLRLSINSGNLHFFAPDGKAIGCPFHP